MTTIINADDGIVSGVAGLKYSADNSGSLVLQTNGTTAITISAAQVVTFTNPVNFASAVFTSITDSGNLTFTGTGNRITGDFSNATFANRVAFQGSTTNGNTKLTIIPNGTAVTAGATFFNSSDVANASYLDIATLAAEMRITSTYVGTGAVAPLTFRMGASEALRIDTSGNVGIGVVPSAWNSVFKGTQYLGGTIASQSTGYLYAIQNAYYNSSASWTYITTAAASIAEQSGGGHYWYTAPSGTAGTAVTLTQRMCINNSGNVGIGTNTPNAKLEVYNGRLRINASSDPGLELADTSAVKGYLYYDTTGSDVVSLRHSSSTGIYLNSSGNVGIGTVTPGYPLTFPNAASGTGGVINKIALYANSTNLYGFGVSNNQLDYITAGSHVFYTGGSSPVERMRIDTSGNVGIGTSGILNVGQRVAIAGVKANADAASQGQLLIADTTAYNSSPSAGIQLGVRWNSSGSIAVGCSIQGIKENATDGNFAQALLFTTQANGLSPAVSMKIDGVGRVTTPSQTAFRAYAGTNVNYTTASTKIQVHDQIFYNVGNNYSTGTFRFTAPVAGIYMFVARCWAQQGNTASAGIQFLQNGAGIATIRMGSSIEGFSTLQVVANAYLAANDYIELYTEDCSASGIVHTSSGGTNSMFAGYLLG